MELTNHAISKLEIYSIDLNILKKAVETPLFEFYDSEEHSIIRIINIDEIPFV